jgi:hypothetical protein
MKNQDSGLISVSRHGFLALPDLDESWLPSNIIQGIQQSQWRLQPFYDVAAAPDVHSNVKQKVEVLWASSVLPKA